VGTRFKQWFPQIFHSLTLRYGVRGDKRRTKVPVITSVAFLYQQET
jgi:hypothetical protein